MMLVLALGYSSYSSYSSSIDVSLAACDVGSTAWARASPPNIPANSSFVVRGSNQCLNVEAWGTRAGAHVWTTACKTETAPHVLNRTRVQLHPSHFRKKACCDS